MEKLNQKGFVLAETLVVSVFLMVMFTMIYTNFYPLIGLYEEKENYDDVDGKYTAYWIKKLVESKAYNLAASENIHLNGNDYFYRFSCDKMGNENNEKELCLSLVKELEISGCDSKGENCCIDTGNNCSAYIVGPKYTGTTPGFSNNAFKNFKNELDTIRLEDAGKATSQLIPSFEKDYIFSLPDYSKKHKKTNYNYRLVVITRHQRNGSDYYGFSTIEVKKS